MTKTERTKCFDKELMKIPKHISKKFMLWVALVKAQSIMNVRKKHKGFCDEALKGKRKGQRSIRLILGIELFIVKKRLIY